MVQHKANILLVEDDKNLSYIVKDFLEMQGYRVVVQKDGVGGLQTFIAMKFDLCLLDVMMPIKDGFTLAEEIRAKDEEVPIVFLTAKVMETDRIRGFKAGADDYITKPFSIEELSLRIEAILKRSKKDKTKDETKDIFVLGIYTFDYANQVLRTGNIEKHLTRREAEVLKMLCVSPNKLVKREDILKNIWGENNYFMGRSMDVYIVRLRKYLRNDLSINILNVHGTGFKLSIKI